MAAAMSTAAPTRRSLTALSTDAKYKRRSDLESRDRDPLCLQGIERRGDGQERAEHDDAIALGVRVYDEKRKQMIEPDLVMDRLDRSRAAATIAPNTPAVAPAASAIPSAARMSKSPT